MNIFIKDNDQKNEFIKTHFLNLLNNSYDICKELERVNDKYNFISIFVFRFETYDTDVDKLFVDKAIEVCLSVANGTTFEYQKDKENYKWYLIMVNMPFFRDKIEWGTSIRGAFLTNNIKISTTGFFDGENSMQCLNFNKNHFELFINTLTLWLAET